jgi:hypothetical protein
MKLIFFVIPFLFGFGSCVKPIPEFNEKIWVGNPDNVDIERAQDPTDPKISCTEERFRGAICFEPDAFKEFVRIYVTGCHDYGKNVKLIPAYQQQKQSFPEGVN